MSKQIARYYRCLKSGMCTRCGQNRLSSATLCVSCLDGHRTRMKRQRELAKSFRRTS